MNQTVGQQLQHAREQLGISLDDAARETHIRSHYLQNLEDDHPELLHSATQARGFLRLYAEFLSLPYEELLTLWEKGDEETQAAKDARAADAGAQPSRPGLTWLKKFIPEKGEPEADQPDLTGEDVPQSANDNEISTDENLAEPVEPEIEATPAPAAPIIEPESEKSDLFLDEETFVEEPSTGVQRYLRNILTALAGIGRKISTLIPFLKSRKTGEEHDGEFAPEDASRIKSPSQTSEDTFNQIGAMLYARRKAMELSLNDIENFTNLKRAFLIALEEGRFNDLPSTVQGRGMLSNYAQFLGMQETEVLDLFSQALQLQREERLRPQRKPVKPAVSVKVNLPDRWRKILNPDLVIGSILIVGLFVFIIWGASQVFSHSGSGPTEAPSISEVLQTTPSVSPAPNLAETERVESTAAAAAVTEIPGVAVVENTPTIIATVNVSPLQVVIIAHDRAYLKIIVDGVETFNGRVTPNNVYTYSGETSINILTGNASALEVYFNQEYIGKLGEVGEVANIDFTLNGLSTPAPQSTPTPTPGLPAGDLDTEAAAG